MPKNTLTDLRNHLFETIERLKDKDEPMDLSRAHAISEVAQTIINSAKVEVQFIAAGGDEENQSGFFDERKALAQERREQVSRAQLGRGGER